MSKHTPEPWHIGEPKRVNRFIPVRSESEFTVCEVLPMPHNAEIANAQRIVDCVNALSGLNPSAVATMREALETIASYGKDGICPYGCDTPNIARAALAKFEETK
jgi:hypothetical protein